MWPFSRTDVKQQSRASIPPAIRELLELLEKLKKRDWRCDRVFRASEHRYELNPCLSQEELASFENQHNVLLPTDYREFLQYAGNGGVGPDYGLIPLNEALPRDDQFVRPSLLSIPFAHTENITREKFAAIESDDPFWEYFYSDRFISGCLRLSTSGCGNYDLLVVNGPAKGTVWSDWRGSEVGILSQQIGFYEWYRDWLSQALDIARLA